MTLAICNTETGLWEEDHIAISADTLKSGVLDAATDGEIKDTEPMVTADGEVIEVKSDSTKTEADIKEDLMESVTEALEAKD